ncbi:MAG: PHP domain-containing protein [Clostridia bacterium]|nr:PHP domain-containing protein [Clostridia bacterium]
MDEYKVDYHIHSTHSDGMLKPTDICKKYKELDYDIISITDHDTISGLTEAQIAAEAVEIKVINGIEISCRNEDGINIHILGYDFDEENPELLEYVEEAKKRRQVRNDKLLQVLNEMGYELTYEDLTQHEKQKYYGKPHFARALVNKGYAKDYQEAFDKILLDERVKAVKMERIKPEEAIKLIANAGGMPVFAHPGKTKKIGERESKEFYKNIALMLKKYKEYGLKGVEAFHPFHSEKECFEFVQIAGRFHMHVTSGSDLHDDNVK